MKHSDQRGAYRRGDTWWYHFSHGGRRYQKAAPVNTLASALTARTRALERIAHGLHPLDLEVQGITVRRVVTDYCEVVSEKRVAARYAVCKRHLTESAMADVLVERLTDLDLKRYRVSRLAVKLDSDGEPLKQLTVRTVNMELALLRAAINYAKSTGAVQRSVFDTLTTRAARERVFARHVSDYEFKRFTNEEFEKIVSFLPEYAQRVARFALATGCRRDEMLLLTWDRVLSGYARLVDTKSGRPRDIVLSAAARALMPQRRPGVPWVFWAPPFRALPARRIGSITMSHLWGEAAERAGRPDVTLHGCRHEWASRFLEAGGTLRELMDAGGWSSLAMVQRYASSSRDRIAAVLERMS